MFRLSALVVLSAAVSTFTSAAAVHFRGYDFESYVITDHQSQFPEIQKNGKSYLQVKEGSEYSIIIKNPLPVRVAVAVTVDGLNTIDGKRTTPDKAEKWIIDANSSLTLRGWQTDRSALRRFVFTNHDGSYAEWKGKHDDKEYTPNLGVIGVAYFWNKHELALALNPPQPFACKAEEMKRTYEKSAVRSASSAKGSAIADEVESRAGTGMGERENNSVINVEYTYDTGMYRTKDVLAIYYEFAINPPLQEPFVNDNDVKEFTPEMP